MIITTYGKEAIAAASAGKTVISFTSLKTTDSTTLVTPSGGKQNFSRIKQSVSPAQITFDKKTATAVVSGVFKNDDLGAAYTIIGVGLYAKCTGTYSQTTEALFAYEFFTTGDLMPLPTDSPQSYSYQFNTTISDSNVVNITIETGTYALASDLQNLSALVEEFKPKNKRVRCNNTVESSAVAGFNWVQEVPIPGMTSDYWVDCFVSGGTYNGAMRVESMTDKAILFFVTKPATSVYVTIIYMKTYS